ncbi:MAG: PAS domain S-box protein [Chloroherpetonaceae bacterium]|nr:PAS domain S-box protein [Chloroherpetonaceae bacterium]
MHTRSSRSTARRRTALPPVVNRTFYEGLFEHNPTPMWVYDEKTLRFIAVNKAACQRYGYSKKEFLTMTIAEIRPPETVAAMLQKAKEIRRQKKAYTGLWQHRTKSGEVFTAEIHSHRVRFHGQPGRLVIAFDVSQRLKLEHDILQRERQLNLFFQQALDGFYFMMLDNPIEWHNAPDKEAALDYILHHERMVEANDAMLAQYGLSREEFIGRTPADFYAHNLDYARRIWRENLDGEAYLMVTDERRADGTQIWIEGHYIPLFNEEGKFIGHFGIQRDITERKKAEEALRQSEERYRIAAENTGQLIYDLDISSGKINWVGAIEQVSGFTPEEFAQIDLRTWEEMIHPEDRAAATYALHEAMKAGKPYNEIYRFRHKDGHYIYVEDNGDFLLDAQGKAYRMIGTMKDITERKKIEEMLREQATLLDKVHDAVIIRDLNDRVQYWNRSAERIYGYSAEEVIGKPLIETFWQKSHLNAQYIIDTVLREGYWSGELRVSHKSG